MSMIIGKVTGYGRANESASIWRFSSAQPTTLTASRAKCGLPSDYR
jgi:hypothetical protein